MAYRGGVAFVAPLGRAPEQDDLIVVRLGDQLDPDTGTSVSIRLWAPTEDQEGKELALRLRSTSSVEPLTVQHRDRLAIVGEVVGHLRETDVGEFVKP
jgi:hypothetical protein